jgi:hypothetical protein
MSSMLTLRLAPDASSRVCQLTFGLSILTRVIAGATFLRQSVPGQSGCSPKDKSEANPQFLGAM